MELEKWIHGICIAYLARLRLLLCSFWLLKSIAGTLLLMIVTWYCGTGLSFREQRKETHVVSST